MLVWKLIFSLSLAITVRFFFSTEIKVSSVEHSMKELI